MDKKIGDAGSIPKFMRNSSKVLGALLESFEEHPENYERRPEDFREEMRKNIKTYPKRNARQINKR
jgi:hypothetical protein